MNRLKGAMILFAIALVTGLTTGQRQTFGLDVNELLTLEPAVVPDSVDGSPWYYTPSRKAHMYRHKYPSAASIGQKQTKQGEDMRLSGDLRPSLYDVRLLPFIEVGNFTTDGYVEITFNCIRSTSNISINALQLTIDRASISVNEQSLLRKKN
jgi:aminopeptidase N